MHCTLCFQYIQKNIGLLRITTRKFQKSYKAKKKPKAVGFDFPQDYAIREIERRAPEIDEFVVHNVFLKKGILNIEYLTNLKSIREKRVKFMAIPLKLKGVEGSPVRAIAIED